MRHTPLQLDFIQPVRRPRWFGLLLLALALGVAAQLGTRWQDAREALQRMQASDSMLNSDRPRAKPVPAERLDDHVKAAEAVVRNLTLPWASLIETLEGTSNEDVAVLQIQPDAQQRLLRVTGEARNQNAMWQYVNSLATTRDLADVHLLNHQIMQEDPQKPLLFSLQARIKAAL
jgi:hypothetical protein